MNEESVNNALDMIEIAHETQELLGERSPDSLHRSCSQAREEVTPGTVDRRGSQDVCCAHCGCYLSSSPVVLMCADCYSEFSAQQRASNASGLGNDQDHE